MKNKYKIITNPKTQTNMEITQTIQGTKFPFILKITDPGYGDALHPLAINAPIIGITFQETEDEEGDTTEYSITFYNRQQLWESIITLNKDISECYQGYIDHGLTGTGLTTDSLNDAYLQTEIVNFLTQSDDPYSAYHQK